MTKAAREKLAQHVAADMLGYSAIGLDALRAAIGLHYDIKNRQVTIDFDDDENADLAFEWLGKVWES